MCLGLQSRGITLAHTSGGGAGGLSLEEPHPSGKRVHLDKDGALVWPVLFLYPEFGQTDLVEAFVENQLFEEHVDAMLGSERPPWDVKNQYTPSNVEVCECGGLYGVCIVCVECVGVLVWVWSVCVECVGCVGVECMWGCRVYIGVGVHCADGSLTYMVGNEEGKGEFVGLRGVYSTHAGPHAALLSRPNH